MDALEAAILRTVLYADIFAFPLTAAEIHHFLISDRPVSLVEVEQRLAESLALQQALDHADGYFARAGRADLIAARHEREQASAQLWEPALRYGRWLACLPFVRMVGLTGALSMRNARGHDDLDYLLLTAPGRVWLARAFSILLVRLVRLRGDVLCPNYVLAETALAQEPRNLFIAHEIAQMIPLDGLDLYARFRAANPWVSAFLANANAPFYCPAVSSPGAWRWLKRAGEWALGGRLGDAFERWEYRRKLARFAPEMATPGSAARLDDARVKGHFNDHGQRVLDGYAERVRDVLPATTLPQLAPTDE